MAHYSRREGRWISRPKRMTVDPDPYDSNSPGHTERHRETVTTMYNGIVRLDLGEPIK